jgi:multidrug resistance protein, MATE family
MINKESEDGIKFNSPLLGSVEESQKALCYGTINDPNMQGSDIYKPPISRRAIILSALKLSTPLLLATISDTATNIITNHLIVALDNKTSDAVNLITATAAFGTLTFSGVVLVTSNFTSESKSAGKLLEVGTIYRQSLLISLLFSTPSITLFAFSKPLLTALGQGSETVSACEKFFNYFIINVPGYFMLTSVQQSLSGLEKQLLIAGFNIISLPAFYAVGHYLSSSLEGTGIAIAYAIRSWGLLIAYHAYLLFNKETSNKYKFFSLTGIQNELKQFKEIIKIGSPVILNIFGELGEFYMLNLIVGWLGGDAQIIQNVSTQYMFFSVTPSLALAQSAGILIGNALGSQRYSEVRRAAHIHLALGISTILTLSGLAISLTPQLTNLFTPDKYHEDYHPVRTVLAIYCVAELFDTSRNILTIGALRGLRDTFFPTVSNILSLWTISIPAAYILSTVFEMGLPGIALGQCIGMAVSNIPLLYRWYKKSNPQQLGIQANRTAPSTSSNDKGPMHRSINWCFWKKPTEASRLLAQDRLTSSVDSEQTKYSNQLA